MESLHHAKPKNVSYVSGQITQGKNCHSRHVWIMYLSKTRASVINKVKSLKVGYNEFDYCERSRISIESNRSKLLFKIRPFGILQTFSMLSCKVCWPMHWELAWQRFPNDHIEVGLGFSGWITQEFLPILAQKIQICLKVFYGQKLDF